MTATTQAPTTRKRVEVICLTYGEPPEHKWRPQYEYSLSILRRLTLRVAPIPKFLLPLFAARRGRIRKQGLIENQYFSPLNEISHAQANAVAETLKQRQPNVDFHVACIFEFCAPFLLDYLETLKKNPPDEIVVLPLYLAEGDFTSGVSRTDFSTFHRACSGTNPLPAPMYVKGLGFDQKLGKVLADFIWQHCQEAGWSEDKCANAALILGAHGTIVYPPPGINNGGKETCHAFGMIRTNLRERFKRIRIGWLNHTLGGKWTEPEVAQSAREVQEVGVRDVVYFPFGFLGDNGESQQEGRAALDEFEWNDMLYLPCPNTHGPFIEYLADKVVERLDQPREDWETIEQGTPELDKRERYVPKGKPGPLNFNGPTLAIVACLFWLGIGSMLMVRGAKLLPNIESHAYLLGIGLIATVIGYFKGTMILGKMAKKNLVRLRRVAQPSPWYRMFPVPTWCIIIFMMFFGMTLRFIPMPDPLRATILLGVGGALFFGGCHYITGFKSVKPLDKLQVRPANAPSQSEA